MCADCSQKYRIDTIDRSLWKLEMKEEVVIQDSNDFFKVLVPITPLIEKRESNFNVPKPCLKKKFKEDNYNAEFTVPIKKRKCENHQSASSKMFNKQFTPMETRSKNFDYKKRIKKILI
jgi:hypothetical protein